MYRRHRATVARVRNNWGQIRQNSKAYKAQMCKVTALAFLFWHPEESEFDMSMCLILATSNRRTLRPENSTVAIRIDAVPQWLDTLAEGHSGVLLAGALRLAPKNICYSIEMKKSELLFATLYQSGHLALFILFIVYRAKRWPCSFLFQFQMNPKLNNVQITFFNFHPSLSGLPQVNCGQCQSIIWSTTVSAQWILTFRSACRSQRYVLSFRFVRVDWAETRIDCEED